MFFVMLLRNLIERHVSDRAAPSFRRSHAAFRVLPTPFSQHAQQCCALKIHLLCLHLESRRLVRVPSTGVWDGIPNGRPAGRLPRPRKDRGQWCLSAGTETLLSGGGGRRWGSFSQFFALWCRDNYILFNRLPDPLGQH